METVATRLRREDREALRALTPGQRVALAFALGERDLELFRRARRPPLARDEAARALERQRQLGRRRSGCLDALLG